MNTQCRVARFIVKPAVFEEANLFFPGQFASLRPFNQAIKQSTDESWHYVRDFTFSTRVKGTE